MEKYLNYDYCENDSSIQGVTFTMNVLALFLKLPLTLQYWHFVNIWHLIDYHVIRYKVIILKNYFLEIWQQYLGIYSSLKLISTIDLNYSHF